MIRLELQRLWNDTKQTIGTLTIYKNEKPIFVCLCIERGDLGNRRNVSRVLAGTYIIRYEYSPRFRRNLWELKGVPNRSETKIHVANYWYQLNGCIAPGVSLIDINYDGYLDVTDSTITLNKIQKYLNGLRYSTITIKDEV